MQPARLNKFDKDEWRDVGQRLWPAGYTEADFERDWIELQEMKHKRARQ